MPKCGVGVARQPQPPGTQEATTDANWPSVPVSKPSLIPQPASSGSDLGWKPSTGDTGSPSGLAGTFWAAPVSLLWAEVNV